MASICHRCSLRLRHAAFQSSIKHDIVKRTFSTTPLCQGRVPDFPETSNAELNSMLLSLRDKHFIPASLEKPERRFIFAEKNAQMLEDSPRFVTLADSEKEVQLHHISRKNEVPKRSMLVARTIDLISRGKSNEWTALPALLQALKAIVHSPLADSQIEKIIRLAEQQNRLGEILRCLDYAEQTGWSLSQDVILRNLLLSVRRSAQRNGWALGVTTKAMRRAIEIATMLDSERHGAGRTTLVDDARKRPEIIGVFLEIAAVNAFKHQDSKDEGGIVQAYAQRLLANIAEQGAEQPQPLIVDEKGRQQDFLFAISIYHGLCLAQKILGPTAIPSADLARKVTANYGSALKDAADKLQQREPRQASYEGQALAAWQDAQERVAERKHDSAGKKLTSKQK